MYSKYAACFIAVVSYKSAKTAAWAGNGQISSTLKLRPTKSAVFYE